VSNVKNYHQQGGEKWVVEGELEFAQGGRLFFNGQEVKQILGQANSTASTVDAIKEDFNALLGRLFTAGLMVVDKSALETAISDAQVILDAATVGILLGQYYKSDYDTFESAIETALTVADNAQATQNQVAAAQAALELAVSTFEAAVIAVDKVALIVDISDAQVILDAAVVGTELGEYPEAAYNTFSAAIDTAQAVVDSKTAIQDDIDTAVATLELAVSTFEAAVIV
jgi:hypothetical protein